MAVAQLKSQNSSLSYIIRKNPETSFLQLIPERKGHVAGWWNDNTYNMAFLDGDDEVSFPQNIDGEFEYLNLTRYSSPIAYLSFIKNFLDSAFKSQSEKDIEGYQHTFHIENILVQKEFYLTHFNTFFKDYTVEYTEIAQNYYSITVTTNKSLYHLLNFVGTLLLVITASNPDTHINIDEGLLSKFVNSLVIIDAPYFIRYLFKTRIIGAPSFFKKYKHKLEEHSTHKFSFEFGDTAYIRRDVIASHLDYTKNVVDVGCGEGFYVSYLAKKLSVDSTYHAIDTNETELDFARKKAERSGLSNVYFYTSLEDFLEKADDTLKYQFVLAEVIEHMNKEEAESLIEKIVSFKGFDSLIITTPNGEFNIHYMLENEFRHDDHNFEMTSDEFFNWIQFISATKPTGKVTCFDIGDSVDGVHFTNGCIVK